jgi:ABC-2 type transport system permease protein
MRYFTVMTALIRRELWEHRVLLLAPIALCAMYLLLCILAGANINTRWIHFEGAEGLGSPRYLGYFAVLAVMFTGMLSFLMAIIAAFYLADCLYAERRDRSILFWKSLPVSDASTVLSKLLVVLIVVPLVVVTLAVVTNLLAYVSFLIQLPEVQPNANLPDMSATTILKIIGVLFLDVFVLALWYSPIAGYQVLVSAWAKRNALVWTFLPPIAIIFAERLFAGTWNLGKLLLHRLTSGLDDGSRTSGSFSEPFAALNALPLLTRAELWIGVAIAAALVLLAIRIRRHSDDT